MANGRFTLGKQSGGTLGLVFPDGVSNTEVVLPESGELVTKDYVDNGAGVPFAANDDRVKTALNATGTAPIYACRAWVNFNGIGTVAIRASGNVSSITDNGVGNYRVNFTTAMPDSLASVVASSDAGAGAGDKGPYLGSISTTSASIFTYNSAGALVDSQIIDIAVFR